MGMTKGRWMEGHRPLAPDAEYFSFPLPSCTYECVYSSFKLKPRVPGGVLLNMQCIIYPKPRSRPHINRVASVCFAGHCMAL